METFSFVILLTMLIGCSSRGTQIRCEWYAQRETTGSFRVTPHFNELYCFSYPLVMLTSVSGNFLERFGVLKELVEMCYSQLSLTGPPSVHKNVVTYWHNLQNKPHT